MKEIKERPERHTHILYVFVIKLIVESFFDGLLLFGDFVEGWYLHPGDHHLERKTNQFQIPEPRVSLEEDESWYISAFSLKHTYRLFPFHELAFCKLLIWYEFKPEHSCVTAMPEEETQSRNHSLGQTGTMKEKVRWLTHHPCPVA